MLLQWTILYRELVGQHRKKRADAFADPLDSGEWQCFGWVVRWLEKSARRRSQAPEGKAECLHDAARGAISGKSKN
ncbi:hypothetical protein SM0020_28305 [Sinorhizobium meliloti CCNWSX0020]|uniref:Uncharacterized protein n=1 Tax=Sinorhizobium meliloti CCNWSX0020 TaxID=1107881 RepID=H0G826_RHIML|nr:hypothetical protein [Sinorhizobium meliloti]EHK74543.1 hypothetical protein SM0020_28305 [Sinorhizobium meliloti CCNWSX0020]RVE82184.1 hypothetical protein CN238_28450 [Sinorhizobium meliloti]RVG63463.1 hypothetical protein CN220_27695 [Sinorhizobium meliloti]RVH23148.1 hypothetical protein CN214_28265 [Sinorhizobium meliloti]RVH29298.1 hypothetical protein CN211_24535 [Sinorhizobium meliloti]